MDIRLWATITAQPGPPVSPRWVDTAGCTAPSEGRSPCPVYALLLSGKLNTEAEQVDGARDMMQRLVKDMVKHRASLSSSKPPTNGMGGRMNNIRSAAEEIVLREVVYA